MGTCYHFDLFYGCCVFIQLMLVVKIPGSVIPSVIFTSLAVYLTSLRALLAQPTDGENSNGKVEHHRQNGKGNIVFLVQ